MDEEIKVIRVINDPEHCRATAPRPRVLTRPKIHYWLVPLYLAGHFATSWLVMFAVGAAVYRGASQAADFANTYSWMLLLALFLLLLRFPCIFCVRMYQRYAKAEVRLRCFMTPSCSEYAILAFRKYGAIVGGIKTIGRLKRCHPPGAIDYP